MKTYIFSIFLIVSYCHLWGQGEAENRMLDIIPPTPMAHEITRFEAQQPDLYTGAMRFSIPLYTIDFDGWKLPLTLDYRATGVTTNQEAIEVGLGWTLNRIKAATHNTGNYNMAVTEYDKNGNIRNLERTGLTDTEKIDYGMIDQLGYDYLGNRLITFSEVTLFS